MPGGMEAVVESFQKNWGVLCAQERVVEEGLGFAGIGHGGLFEENMFSGTKGAKSPGVVVAVWERVVDTVDGGISNEIYRTL